MLTKNAYGRELWKEAVRQIEEEYEEARAWERENSQEVLSVPLWAYMEGLEWGLSVLLLEVCEREGAGLEWLRECFNYLWDIAPSSVDGYSKRSPPRSERRGLLALVLLGALMVDEVDVPQRVWEYFLDSRGRAP